MRITENLEVERFTLNVQAQDEDAAREQVLGELPVYEDSPWRAVRVDYLSE